MSLHSAVLRLFAALLLAITWLAAPATAPVGASGAYPSAGLVGATSAARTAALEPAATRTASGWATAMSALSPEVLQVRTATGETLRVRHIGLIGPSENQGAWRTRATDAHARIIQPQTRIWLELQDGVEDPNGRWLLRHVYRDGVSEEPMGAELLRSGMTWVFPHTSHPFIRMYADRQAEAVLTQAGLWAETRSSAVYLPAGATYGGLPVNPLVVPALQALEADPLGKELLSVVNDFPVEVGVTRLPRGILGYFEWRFYSVQVARDLLDAPPESIAAVLIHELTHTRQMISAGVLDEDLGCFDREIEAFEITARYWTDLYGPGGKRQPAHWLDRTLNENLRDFNNGRIAQQVRRAYGHQCG